MNLPCANRSNECACDASEFSNPFANLSSEDPDHPVYIQNFGYKLEDGGGWCEEDSLENLANCLPGPTVCNNCPPVCRESCDPPTDSNTVTVYYNRETSCTYCGYTYTVPAGVYVSYVSQADADARAQSACQYRACNGPDGPRRIPSTCPANASITGYGQTSPVTAGPGDTVVLDVFYSYTGTAPISFTWWKDGFPFAVTPGASLTLANVDTPDAGIYMLVIRVTGCPAVLSAPIELIIDPCHQGGDTVPSDFYSLTVVDLGDHTLVPNGGIDALGIYGQGQFEITYMTGCFTSASNPCPGQWKVTTGFHFNYDGGGSFLELGSGACGATEAEAIANHVALMGGVTQFVAHTAGNVTMTPPADPGGPSCGTFCPTWNVKYREFPALTYSGIRIKDWDTHKTTISNCPAISTNPAFPEWDAQLDMTDGFLYSTDFLTFFSTWGINSTSFDGNKKLGFVQASGPLDWAELTAYEPDWGAGIFAGMDPAKYYWVLEIWGYSDGLANITPCWLGVKSYGRDLSGRYEMKSSCATLPSCLTIENFT